MENPARYLAEIARLRAALELVIEMNDWGGRRVAEEALAEGPQITEEESASGATDDAAWGWFDDAPERGSLRGFRTGDRVITKSGGHARIAAVSVMQQSCVLVSFDDGSGYMMCPDSELVRLEDTGRTIFGKQIYGAPAGAPLTIRLDVEGSTPEMEEIADAITTNITGKRGGQPAQPAPDIWQEHEECLRVQADLIADVRELVENLEERLDKMHDDVKMAFSNADAGIAMASRVAQAHEERLDALRLNFEAHIAEQVGFWSTTEDRLSALESRISDESDLRGAQIVNLQIEVHGGNLDGRPVVGLIDRLSAIEIKLATQIVPVLSEAVEGEMGASGATPQFETWISREEAIIAMNHYKKALERIVRVTENAPGGYVYRDALNDCVDIARQALDR